MPNTPDNKGIGLSFSIGKKPIKNQLPLRILVLSTLSTNSKYGSSPTIRINKDNFSQVIASSKVAIDIEVENYLSAYPTHIHSRLTITDLADLSPAGIIAQVPELTGVYLFKERLQLLTKGEINPDEFMSGLDAYQNLEALNDPIRLCRNAFDTGKSEGKTTSSVKNQEANGSDEILDRIFDMVGKPPERKEKTNKSGIEHIISQIGKERAGTAMPDDIYAAIELTTNLINKQVNAILHHPRFQIIEEGWRGLKFLVDRTDFRSDISLEVIDTSRQRLADTLHKHVFEPANESHTDIPVSLIVLDFSFDKSNVDLELLQEIGEQAESVQTPVLFALRPSFFELTTGAEATNLPFLGTVLDQPKYEKWNALRNKECARWLCATFNPFLLRPKFSPENSQGLDFIEQVQSHNQYLWGNPVWLITSLITRSYARTGWPTEFTGSNNGQIENLDLHGIASGRHKETQIPLAALLSMDIAEDMAEFGFIALICQPNRDSVYVLQAPTLRKPPKYNGVEADSMSRSMVSLPYQLLASRIAAYLADQKSQLTSGKSPQEIETNFGEVLQELLAGTGHGSHVNVKLEKDPNPPRRDYITLDLRTGQDILNGASLYFSLPL